MRSALATSPQPFGIVQSTNPLCIVQQSPPNLKADGFYGGNSQHFGSLLSSHLKRILVMNQLVINSQYVNLKQQQKNPT